MKVTATQAALLVGRDVSVIRWHLSRGDLQAERVGGRRSSARKRLEGGAWRIDVDDLEAIPGWTVNRQRLAELEAHDARTAEGLAATVARLQREVTELRLWVRRLEGARATGENLAAIAPRSDYGANLTAQAAWGSGDTSLMPTERPVAVYVASGTDSFRRRTDALRWLHQHVTDLALESPKTWHNPEWRKEVLMTKRAVLEDAIMRQERADWRATWRLHRCVEDPECICRELLPG